MAVGRAGAPRHDADGDADRHRERPAASPGSCAATSSSTSASETASLADRNHKAYPVLDREQRRQRDDRARRSGREGTGHSASALALRRRRHRRARRRLRAGPHLRRRLSQRRSARPRLRSRRHARPRQLPEVRHLAARTRCPGCASRSAGACRRAARFLRHFLYQGFNEDEQGRQACSTASSIRSAAPAADRSTTASARRRATRCSSSTSCFRSICFRSPTDRKPIPEDWRDRQPARARRAHRHRAEGLSPADQLGVLQPRRLARPHRSDRDQGRRAAARTHASA